MQEVKANEVLAEWGSPFLFVTRRRMSKDEAVESGQNIEIIHEIDVKKPVSPREFSTYLGKLATEMKEKHPEFDLKYLSVERSSPQKIRMQMTRKSPQISVLTIIRFTIAAVAVAAIAYFGWKIIEVIGTSANEIISIAKTPWGAFLIMGGTLAAGYFVIKRTVKGKGPPKGGK